jgi:predicted nucleic acid-binding protein
VALVNPRDENHEKANELVDAYDKKPLLVTDAVLLEIGNSLAKGYKQNAIEIIEEFFDSPEVEIVRLDEILFDKAFELYKSHTDKTWGLVDCISFALMWERGISEVLTFDRRDFEQAGFVVLKD